MSNIIITQKNGIETRARLAPEGFDLFKSYTPTSSVTPWDYYGMKEMQKWSAIAKKAGIPESGFKTRVIHRKSINPYPTGPNGSVRFGDDMMPGIYELWIDPIYTSELTQGFDLHRKERDAWLNDGAEMPDTIVP